LVIQALLHLAFTIHASSHHTLVGAMRFYISHRLLRFQIMASQKQVEAKSGAFGPCKTTGGMDEIS